MMRKRMIHASTLYVYVYSVAVISNPCLLDKLCFRGFFVLLGFFVCCCCCVWGFFFWCFFFPVRGVGWVVLIWSRVVIFFKKIGMVNVPFFFSCSKRGAFIFLKFSNCLNRDVVDCFTQTYLIELYFVFICYIKRYL